MALRVSEVEAQSAEVQLAADVVMLLFVAKLMPMTAKGLRAASEATGVPVSALREAHGRWESGHLRKIGQRPFLSLIPITSRNDEPPKSTKRGGQPVKYGFLPRQPWETRDGKRCPVCERLLPLSRFALRKQGRIKKNGEPAYSRQGWCRECMLDRSRRRYVTVTKPLRDAKQQEKRRRIAMEVLADDELLGVACACCGKPFEVGDLASAGLGALVHIECDAPPENSL